MLSHHQRPTCCGILCRTSRWGLHPPRSTKILDRFSLQKKTFDCHVYVQLAKVHLTVTDDVTDLVKGHIVDNLSSLAFPGYAIFHGDPPSGFETTRRGVPPIKKTMGMHRPSPTLTMARYLFQPTQNRLKNMGKEKTAYI